MNSVSIIYADNAKYYLDLGAEGKDDYYSSDLDPRGTFLADEIKEFSIHGDKIEHQDPRFRNLFDGLSPDGSKVLRHQQKERIYYHFSDPETKKTKVISKKIAQEIKQENPNLFETNIKTTVSKPIIGFDNVFSANKDVDVLWALAPTKELRQQIHNYHKEAVAEAIESFKTYVKSRSGKGGKDHVSAKLVLAVFNHTTSRELDPNLHSHVVMLNLGLKPDSKWGALHGESILAEGRYISGQVYQNALRKRIELGLGLKCKTRHFEQGKGKTFTVVGLSPELKREFSQRSLQIEKVVTANMTGAEKRVAVLKSRRQKIRDLATDELMQDWQNRAKAYDFDWDKLLELNSLEHRFSKSADIDNQKSPTAELLNTKTPTSKELHTPPVASPAPKKPRKQKVGVENEYRTFKPRKKSRRVSDRTTVKTPTRPQNKSQKLKKTYRAIATHLQQNQPAKGFKAEQILFAALEATEGNQQQAQKVAQQFQSRYVRKSRVNRRLRLKKSGHKLINFRRIRKRIAETAKLLWDIHTDLKRIGTRVKVLYLYATGKISRKQFLLCKEHQKLAQQRWNREISRETYVIGLDKIRREKQIPAHPWVIRSYQTLGLLSKKQADYWCKITKEYRKPIPLDVISKRLNSWRTYPKKSIHLHIR